MLWVNLSLPISSLPFLIIFVNQTCFVSRDFFNSFYRHVYRFNFKLQILFAGYLHSRLFAHLLFVVVVYISSSADFNMCLNCFRLGFRLLVYIISVHHFIPHFPVYALSEMAAYVSPTFSAPVYIIHCQMLFRFYLQ